MFNDKKKKRKRRKAKTEYCPLCHRKRVIKYRIFAVSPTDPHQKGALKVCQTCNRNTHPGRRLAE